MEERCEDTGFRTKHVPKKVGTANQDPKYYSLRLTCKFGGKAVESGIQRKRKTKNYSDKGVRLMFTLHSLRMGNILKSTI